MMLSPGVLMYLRSARSATWPEALATPGARPGRLSTCGTVAWVVVIVCSRVCDRLPPGCVLHHR